MKLTPTCSCATKDGSRCGRKVTDGSQPPVCHIHKAQAQGTSVSPLTSPAPFDAYERLRKIAAKESTQQLAALRLLIELEHPSCKRCAERDEFDRANGLLNLELCTPEEHQELKAAVATMIRVKKALTGRQPPPEPEPEPEPEVIDVPVVEATPEPEPVIVELPPSLIPLAGDRWATVSPDKWAAAGVYRDPVTNVITSDYGDDHAARIASGELNYEDACRAHATGVKADQRLADHLHQRFLEKS